MEITFTISLVDRSSSTRTACRCPFVGGAIHGQLPHVLVRVENDDIDFRRKEAEQCNICAERCRDTQSSYLYLEVSDVLRLCIGNF